MGCCLIEPHERRRHTRTHAPAGNAHLAARLRTGSPLRVLDTSPDGMLVESPARLLPGRQIDLVLHSGDSREQAPWVVVHSRVGCIRGSSDLRYRAGLKRATGSSYPRIQEPAKERNELPEEQAPGGRQGPANTCHAREVDDGTRFVEEERA
jgi:hypothetical protein